MQQQLPGFLIVGTMKSGTTTLADYLNTHKNIHLPPGEIHYFNNDENYARGPVWYAEQLQHEMRNKQQCLLGEKTPTYSYQANCAERIKTTLPAVKLIWIFRNPVRRTFSNYLHAQKQGAEPLSFRRAVELESQRIKNNPFRGYVERSKYIKQVDRFLEHFDISQMHFLLLENLIENPIQELNKISDFLKISHFEFDIPKVHSNKTIMPASPLSLWVAKKYFGWNSPPGRFVRKLNYIFGKPEPTIPDDIQEQLEILFKPYNQELSIRTGLDLTKWNK